MNWLLMLLSAVAGGFATWLWSVRKVRRQIPVYESEPAPAATNGFVATDDTPAAPAPVADVEASVDAASVPVEAEVSAAAPAPPVAPLVAEQGVLSGLEAELPATAAGDARRAVDPPSAKRKPRTKKKAVPPVIESAEIVVDPPAEESALLGAPENPHGWTIKGNANSGLYHAPASPWYGRTMAEAWFETEHAAEAAGFTRWDQRATN